MILDGVAFLDLSIRIGFATMSLAFFVLLYRIAFGPTIPDRILALDMMFIIAIGFIAIFGIFVRYYIYVDIAIALGLVGFLSTVALARFVLARGNPEELRPALRPQDIPEPDPETRGGHSTADQIVSGGGRG
jgi:multicomponent Na+:H+ antiporter subunit F